MELLADLLRGGLHRRLIGHIEDQRNIILPKLLGKPFGIFRLAHTAKDSKTLLGQNFQNAPAYSCRNTGHDYASHGSLLEIKIASRLMILVFRDCRQVLGMMIFSLGDPKY